MVMEKEIKKNVGKAEIINDFAAKFNNLSKKEAAEYIKAFEEVIAARLEGGYSVRLIPFGSFEIRERKARIGRNPSSREEITIPARSVPVFRPGKLLKDAVKPAEEKK